MKSPVEMAAFFVVLAGGALLLVAWLWTVFVTAKFSSHRGFDALWALVFWPFTIYYAFRLRGRSRIPLTLFGLGATAIAVPLLIYERSGHPYFLAALLLGVVALIAAWRTGRADSAGEPQGKS